MTKEILPFNDPDSFKAAFISEYGANRWNEFVALGKVKAVVKDMLNYKNAELFSFSANSFAEERVGYILHIADEVAAKDVFLTHFGVACVDVAPRLAVTVVDSTLFVIVSQTAALTWPNDEQIKHAVQKGVELFENLNKMEKETPVGRELPAFPTVEKLDQVEKQLIDMFGKTNEKIKIKRDAAATPVNGEPYTALLCHVESVSGAFGVFSSLPVVFSTDLGRPHVAYTNIDNVVIIFYMHVEDEAADAEKDIRYFYDKIAADERIKKAFERAKTKTEKESQTMATDQENAEVRAIQEILTEHGVKFAYKVVDLFGDQGSYMSVPTFYIDHLFPSIDCLAKFNPRHTSDGSYIILPDGQVVLFIEDLWDFNGKRLFAAINSAIKQIPITEKENNSMSTVTEDRFQLGFTEVEGVPVSAMYQHHINIKPNSIRDVACDMLARIQKHKNMHSVPAVAALRPKLQEELRQFGTSPIQVYDGAVCWVKNILGLGIAYSYSGQHQVDLDTNARHDSFVLPMAFDNRLFTVCIDKRYNGKSTTPSYLLNVVEVLGDNQKPYVGDVLEYICQYLAKA